MYDAYNSNNKFKKIIIDSRYKSCFNSPLLIINGKYTTAKALQILSNNDNEILSIPTNENDNIIINSKIQSSKDFSTEECIYIKNYRFLVEDDTLKIEKFENNEFKLKFKLS